MKKISRLQLITTNAAIAELACKGGVDWVQLRLKNVSYEEYRKVALEVQAVCKKYNATFIVNDNVQLALDVQADGVHIGKEDMDATTARKLLGDNAIIGCTANTYEDVARLCGLPVNYIGLGPFRFTATKEKLSPVLGIDGYKSIFARLEKNNVKQLPVIAIGGIILFDVPSLLSAGLHGVAVSGAIGNASDIAGKAKEFIETIKRPEGNMKTPPLDKALILTDVIVTIAGKIAE